MTEQNRIKVHVDLTITLSYSRIIGWRDSRYERKATIDSIVEKNMSCELFNLTKFSFRLYRNLSKRSRKYLINLQIANLTANQHTSIGNEKKYILLYEHYFFFKLCFLKF